MDVDSNDAARQAIILGLGQGGLAGQLAGGLVGILWPGSGNDVWDSIRARVEALINQKLREYEYRNVNDSLTGLKAALQLYRDRLADSQSTPSVISDQYTATKTVFATALPHFQSEPSKLLLLPLFAQFANLHLALLHDGARYGATWGWTPRYVEDEKEALTATISSYRDYALTVYQAGMPHFDNPSQRSNWIALNGYIRRLTLDVLDHRHVWPYFALNSGTPTYPTRTIYSDPVSGSDADQIGFPEPSLQAITDLKVWGDAYVYGLQAAYGGTMAPAQSWTDRGASRSKEITLNATTEAVTDVYGTVSTFRRMPDDYFYIHREACTSLALQIGPNWFQYFVGAEPHIGHPDYAMLGDPAQFHVAYTGHILGSVYVMRGGSGPIIFGFRLKASY